MSPAAPLLLALRSGADPLVSSAHLADLVAHADEPLLLLEDLTGLLEWLSRQPCDLRSVRSPDDSGFEGNTAPSGGDLQPPARSSRGPGETKEHDQLSLC
jgi:hypothetical protein